MDFIPDLELARSSVRYCRNFDTYSAAYLITNENLRESMNFMPKNCKNALVVAASGDHPLFCSLYGAKNVDTFDISYNAKCMMDIKVAALNCLNHKEYKQFLDDLYVASLPEFKKTLMYTCADDMCPDVLNMDKILLRLPKIESDYVYALKKEPWFSCPNIPSESNVLPTFFEYYRLRAKVKQSYNFLLSDIYSLDEKLTETYDFIHLSNILDYTKSGDYGNLIFSLMKRINPRGRIVLQFVNEGRDEVFGFYMANIINHNPNWTCAKEDIKRNNSDIFKNGIYVLERIR